MELTGLKHAINTGVVKENTSLDNTESSSKTLGYKLVKNASLPKFLDGFFPQQSFTNTQNPGLAAKTPSLIDPNGFGGSNFLQPVSVPHIDWSDGVQSSMAVGQTKALTGSFGNGNAIDLNKSNLMLSKQINNGLTSRTNSGKAGQGIGASSIGGIINNGIQFAGDAINAFSTNESGEDIANRQGTSQMSIGGVGYESQNSIDVSKEMDKVKRQNTTNTLALMGSGAALGSVIPGVGTAVGAVIGAGVGLLTGIFGSEARKRKYRRMMEELNAKINALQNSARYSAQTKAILLLNAREYGDTETQYLYGAKNGKLPCFNNGVDTSFMIPNAYFYTKYAPQIKEYNSKNKPTYSSAGETNVEPNAKVSKGEIIVNAMLGLGYRIPGKKNNDDTEDAYLNPGDMVVPNKGGLSDYYANTGDYKGTKEMLKNRLETAKNGRLPKFENGWLGNAITSGVGMLGGLSQWLEAKNSSPRRTNSYKSNEYELASLDILSKLGVNPFPIMQLLRNAEARSNRAIDMSGGLTSGQRTLQRLASTTSTQRAIADALANILIQNNSYKSDYAKTALATGAANAQRAMQAYQWDEDMYAKAHAARQQGMQMGMRNMVDLLNSYYANEFKRKQFNETMSLYKDDQKLRADEVLAIINNLNNKPSTYEKASAATSISPTYMKSYGLIGNTNLASKSRLKNPELFWGKNYSLKAPVLPTSYAAYKYLKPYI